MIKPDNYIHISGWMLSSLHLSGNSLLIYAIIYGFSQIEGHYFNGSMRYLEEWTNSTRQGITKNLKDLVEAGLIIKQEASPTNIYFVNRAIIDDILAVNKVTEVETNNTIDVNKVDTECKQSLPNNINNNINNKYIKEKELNTQIEEIITYFNNVCDTKFKSNTKVTRQLIKKRLEEGFTIENFKQVINAKYKEWGLHPKAFSNGLMSNAYLRPVTLFGDKFETYLYEANLKESSEGLFNSISAKVDPDVVDQIF